MEEYDIRIERGEENIENVDSENFNAMSFSFMRQLKKKRKRKKKKQEAENA